MYRKTNYFCENWKRIRKCSGSFYFWYCFLADSVIQLKIKTFDWCPSVHLQLVVYAPSCAIFRSVWPTYTRLAEVGTGFYLELPFSQFAAYMLWVSSDSNDVLTFPFFSRNKQNISKCLEDYVKFNYMTGPKYALIFKNVFFSSTLCVPNVRSHSTDIATMRRKGWRTANNITISCSETCVMSAIKLLLEMVSAIVFLFFMIFALLAV